MNRISKTRCLLILYLMGWASLVTAVILAQDGKPKKLDPTAWGSDHVGKRLPEFMSGDECLFCHRKKVGPQWSTNRHAQTVRPANPDLASLKSLRQKLGAAVADEVEFVLGTGEHRRFLKRRKQYGQLAILDASWHSGSIQGKKNWNETKFAKSCAGCHASGVEAESSSFLATSLDCFTCHGDIQLDHTKNPALALFSKKQKTPARVVASVCGQCHLRTGKSRSSGLPYPNQYVAGDNLFKDFMIDLRTETTTKLNHVDRHIQDNIRQIVVEGKASLTCVSCHDIHNASSKKHQGLSDQSYCWTCHTQGKPKSQVKSSRVRSRVCEY